ncbi:MAG: AAA family ATPase, partial [Bacteroidota bacterium]
MNPEITSSENYFQSRQFEQVLEHGQNCKERRKIVGAFLYEDTTTLLFSRTNYGKSLLVFQFAYAAATGSSFDSCAALSNECEPMKVLVVDLELDSRVLWERHGAVLNDKNPYLQNLYYLHEKADRTMMIGFELLDKIEQAAVEHEAKLVIIDNISKLLPDALKPDTATIVIAMLNRIRINTGASILVIGHTTKGNPRVCIQPTDYYGSAMLQNFFNELSFLDAAKDGNFFLCHSKTKHKECFNQTVPVFSRGDHQRVGVGFTFCNLQNLIDIQL